MNKVEIKRALKEQLPFAIVVPAFMWQILFFYLPICFIFLASFLAVDDLGNYTGFTLSYYKPFFNFTYLIIILKSLMLAILNSVICFSIGYPVAYYIAFRAEKSKNILIMLLLLPFWTNFLLHIYAWFFVLERNGFINTLLLNLGLIKQPLELLNSFFAIMLGMVYSYLPFMILPIYSVLEQFNRKLIESSLDLGATLWQTIKLIILPLSLAGIISGLFLVFVPSFGEFAIPELMGGEKYVFVGNVISKFILNGNTASYGVAFTVLSSLFLIFTIIALYKLKKRYP